METGNETRLIQRIGHTDYRRICLTGESLKTRTKSSNPFIIEKLNTKKAQLNHCAFLMDDAQRRKLPATTKFCRNV
ncbi:hypothetical protein SB48_HM08orf05681 [Heyndrickxia coagulans]|uniref:Uncharacterized protein n=1 Tax=Heyndrickxia coagulans TaxID=1398 RepID=A0AAN0WDD6_HEYCO|nr:hypothetical protein SB48_HM08orf05681 [Heyndrickxia coagulans]